MPTDPAVVANAIRELRTATECTCPDWKRSGSHDQDCRFPWREDVDTLAAEVERLRRVDELARALVERYKRLSPLELDDIDGASPDLVTALDALADEVRDA